MMAATWDDEHPRNFMMHSRTQESKKTKVTKLTEDKFVEYIKLTSEETLLQLCRPNGGLRNFLQDQTKSSKLDLLALRCFSHACKCDLLEVEKICLLSSILESNFVEADLSIYALKQDSLSEAFADDASFVMQKLITKMPTESVKKITLLSQRLSNIRGLTDVIVQRLETIQNLISSAEEKTERQKPCSRIRPDNDDDVPPEDFRILTTIPRDNDLDVNKQPFLRKNRTHARYDNCDQYLDVQFRLLREDLFAPLRESISEYQCHGGKSAQNVSSMKVYLNVRLVRPICRHNGLGYRLSFDTSRLANVHWDTSKRLIFGSLLCLSKDNFQNCVYATVVNKESKDVKNGMIDVSFEFHEVGELNDFVQANRKSRFAMVESPAYYEPYKHVLLAMQNMDDQNFPFRKYVVECDTDISQPAYLRRNPQFAFDLRPVADTSFQFNENSDDSCIFNSDLDSLKYVNIQNDASWPTHDLLRLDLSQSIALRQALCREFAIIQGPPGTGKTHLGLSLLKVLLHNKSIWTQPGDSSTPIVIICYTNHALDQFLLGALDFFKGNMVRVGSRCQVDEIKEFSITNHRKRSRETKLVSQAIHNSRYQLRLEMEALQTEIEHTAVQLQIAHSEILTERCFKEQAIIKDEHLRQLGSDTDDVRLLRWLGIQRTLDDINRTAAVPDDDDQEAYCDHLNDDDDLEELDTLSPLRDIRALDYDEPFIEDDNKLNIIKLSLTLLNVSSLDDLPNGDYDSAERKQTLDEKRKDLRKLKRSLQAKIAADVCMSKEEYDQIRNIRKMRHVDRWRLYRYWTRSFVDKVLASLKHTEIEFETTSQRYKDVLLLEDRDIMRAATIVGLTTTGAAKYQSVLADIGPKIVIFEEAAEVLEGHIVVNLCRQCEHSIFIGDHKQLQPNPAVHKLAKDYNLDISLFERLINNGLPHDALKLQHRMRPQIASIIRVIYPNLKDHEVVKHYDDILGVKNDIAFINHAYPEESDEETKSYTNKFEADYLKSLCDYLIKQGYERSRITVLTTYSGQLNYLTSIFTKSHYPNLRVATVDSYQGQENDIILLSLVRSSQDDGIGFLAKDNRLCVAFSRAKMGFYVIANFEHIQKHSTMLRQMVSQAVRQDLMNEGLALECTNHRETWIVKSPEDFKISEGGCLKPCQQRLKCGHICPLICHSDTKRHMEIKCTEKCVRHCDKGHPCSLPCYKECSPCVLPTKKMLPRCGHEQLVPCSEDPWKFKCEVMSTTTLHCGHIGKGICSPLINAQCFEKIQVKRDCGHTTEVPCHELKSKACNHPCSAILECGHPCNGTCSGCYKGKLHTSCQKKCGRDLVCGHICTDICAFCSPCNLECINKCSHNRCPNKCGDTCIPCNMQCKWRCKHFYCTKRCSETCDRERCNEPCKKFLNCGHLCIGLCGETCPKLCRICQCTEVENIGIWGTEVVNVDRYVLLEDCGHIFEVRGMDTYMDSDDEAIFIKRCPYCKTAIITTMRYGDIAKENLRRIEFVKAKIKGDSSRISKLKKYVDEKRRSNVTMKQFVDRLSTDDDTDSEHRLAAVASQISILEQTILLRKQLEKTQTQLELKDDVFQRLTGFLDDLLFWASKIRTVFSIQEEADVIAEVNRLKYLVKLSVGRERATDKGDEIPKIFISRLATMILTLENNEDVLDVDVDDMLATVDSYNLDSTLGVTNNERLQIVQAIGGRKGSWYQCRNGHYYSIDECGRPVEKSICPECYEAIGGESHTLVSGNVAAPEIDDAQASVHTEESDFLFALAVQFGDRT